MRILLMTVALACSPMLCAQEPDATAIMARVAANQDRSEAERAHFIYVQHARVMSHKGKTLRCEEISDTRVTPTETGSTQQLLKLEGRLIAKQGYTTYTELAPVAEGHEDDLSISIGGDSDTDRQLVEQMRHNFTNDRSKDGIGAGLFPLTSKTQADYRFKLLGQEKLNGRTVFHVAFEPRTKNEYGWKGDAFIDTTAFEPVLVRTTMSRKVPFAVRTLLGTSLPGLGFTVIYAPQNVTGTDEAAKLWFPVSFGTEFRIKILFFFSREITLNAENREFQRTHVASRIVEP